MMFLNPSYYNNTNLTLDYVIRYHFYTSIVLVLTYSNLRVGGGEIP